MADIARSYVIPTVAANRGIQRRRIPMRLPYSVTVFVASIVLAGSALAQPEQNRPAAPAPVAVLPNLPPPSPAQVEAQRRREEQSVELGELLTKVSQATGKKF